MDEQRSQAYLNLISQLLSCNEGDELRIFRENRELLDDWLVQVMVAVLQCLSYAGIVAVFLNFDLKLKRCN